MIWIAVYLIAGILALAILDLTTGRVRRKWREASYDTQDRLAKTGNLVGYKRSVVLFLVALWILWPVAIWGAVSSLIWKGGDDEERTESDKR